MTEQTPNPEQLPPPPTGLPTPPPAASPEQVEAAQDLAEAISTHEWQATSPWTLIRLFGNVIWVFVLYFFYQFSKIGISIGLPDDVVANITEVAPWITPSMITAIIELAVPVVIAVMPIVHWMSIRWRLDEQTIELRQGILWKKHQKMARSRVQTVSLTADIVGRITNTRSVVISSGDTEDIVISLVPVEMAEQLRITIAPRLSTASQPVAGYVRDSLREVLVGHEPGGASVESLLGVDHVPLDQGASPHGPRVDIVRLGVMDWFKYVGLTNAPHVLITLLCAIPVVLVAIFVISDLTGKVGGVVAALSVPALLFTLIPIIFGISMAQLNTWGFTSWIQDGRIHSVQGLVSRFEKGAALQRLQTVSVGQNPIRTWLKLDELKITTADAALASEGTESSILNLVHPLLPAGQWRSIAQQLLDVELPEVLNPPSKRTIQRGVVRTLLLGLPVAAIAGLAEYLFIGSYRSAIILVVLTALAAYPVGLWQFHNFRWAITDACFVVRRGLFFRTITVVPLNLVQNIYADATWFQRRLGLGDVEADVAGIEAPKVRAHDLPIDAADHVEAVLVAHANEAKSKDGV